jgi:hypothetical protein
MHRRLLLACIATAACAAAGARAVEREGAHFHERIRLAGHELVLNGTGVRSAGPFKGYVVALYLPRRAHTVEDVLAQRGAKRMRLVMLMQAPAAELAKALDKGLMRNTPEAERESLRERMRAMSQLIVAAGEVRAGDVVDLDYEPGRGTSLVLNATRRGEPIAGSDFYAGVLRSFIGERPYQKSMRAELLGQPA